MSRRNIEVGEVYSKKWGSRIPITYDRNLKRFEAKVGAEHVEASSQLECETLVRAAIDRQSDLTWFRIIVIEHHKGSDFYGEHAAQVGFNMSRHEVAKLPGTKKDKGDEWVERDFRVAGEELNHLAEEIRAKGQDVKRMYRPDEEVSLPYSDALWDRLLQLLERIRGADKDLRSMLANPNLPILVERGLQLSSERFFPPPTDPLGLAAQGPERERGPDGVQNASKKRLMATNPIVHPSLRKKRG